VFWSDKQTRELIPAYVAAIPALARFSGGLPIVNRLARLGWGRCVIARRRLAGVIEPVPTLHLCPIESAVRPKQDLARGAYPRGHHRRAADAHRDERPSTRVRMRQSFEPEPLNHEARHGERACVIRPGQDDSELLPAVSSHEVPRATDRRSDRLSDLSKNLSQ
jgi:hypothetical protein